MKNTVIIIIVVLTALCFIGCRTSQEAEVSTKVVASTTAAGSSQAVCLSVDSLTRLCSVELDSFELIIENYPFLCPEYQDSTAAVFPATQRITLRAKRAEITGGSKEIKVVSACFTAEDTVAHQVQSFSEQKSSQQEVAVVDPSDMTIIIIGGIIIGGLLIFFAVWLGKKLW